MKADELRALTDRREIEELLQQTLRIGSLPAGYVIPQ